MTRPIFLFFLLAIVASGDVIEETTGQLARKILGRLAADEVAHLNWKGSADVDLLSAQDQARVQQLANRTLQKRGRNLKTIEVDMTWSQNLKGLLLIADIRRNSEEFVEMVVLPKQTSSTPAAPAVRIEKRLIWEQDHKMFDATQLGEDLWILDTSGLTRYRRREGTWEKVESTSLNVPVVRDGRGRITVDENSVTVEFAGEVCQGRRQTGLTLDCRAGGVFSAGRNTLEADGMPPHYARAEWDGETVLSELDGQTRIYDSNRKPVGGFDTWGSDFVTINSCIGPLFLATDPKNAETDSITPYQIKKHEAVRAGEPTGVPGPITAVWAANNRAFAIVNNQKTEHYEAYSISVDCGR